MVWKNHPVWFKMCDGQTGNELTIETLKPSSDVRIGSVPGSRLVGSFNVLGVWLFTPSIGHGKDVWTVWHEICSPFLFITIQRSRNTSINKPKQYPQQHRVNLGATLVRRWYNLAEKLVLAETWIEPWSWRTLVEPWWNLVGTLGEPSAEPFWHPKTDLPHRTMGSTKSNSAPKPSETLPWLKTPKLLLLGRKLYQVVLNHSRFSTKRSIRIKPRFRPKQKNSITIYFQEFHRFLSNPKKTPPLFRCVFFVVTGPRLLGSLPGRQGVEELVHRAAVLEEHGPLKAPKPTRMEKDTVRKWWNTRLLNISLYIYIYTNVYINIHMTYKCTYIWWIYATCIIRILHNLKLMHEVMQTEYDQIDLTIFKQHLEMESVGWCTLIVKHIGFQWCDLMWTYCFSITSKSWPTQNDPFHPTQTTNVTFQSFQDASKPGVSTGEV